MDEKKWKLLISYFEFKCYQSYLYYLKQALRKHSMIKARFLLL